MHVIHTPVNCDRLYSIPTSSWYLLSHRSATSTFLLRKINFTPLQIFLCMNCPSLISVQTATGVCVCACVCVYISVCVCVHTHPSARISNMYRCMYVCIFIHRNQHESHVLHIEYSATAASVSLPSNTMVLIWTILWPFIRFFTLPLIYTLSYILHTYT